MTMPLKEKGLVAIGISVAAGRRPSMDGYVVAGPQARATLDEIKQGER
jgi:alkylhydroperoxidase/carboxymuconolactone decarboxylase family protein YurZ